MAEKRCPKCGKLVWGGAKNCVHCGEKIGLGSRMTPWALGIIALVGLFVVLGQSDRPSSELSPPSTPVGGKEPGQSEALGKAGANSDWRSVLGGGGSTPLQDGKAASNSPSGYPLPIPSDPQARYYVLEKGGTARNPTLVTKRVGSSGTTFSKRLFDCQGGTYKYLGSSDTYEGMLRAKPDPDMTELVTGSISYYTWRHACGK